MNPAVNRRPVLLARRARAYSELKDWGHAEHDLDGALSEISTDSELWQARGYARFQQSNQGKDQDKLKQAISDYQQALKTNQDNGLARAQLAAAFVLSRRFKEALAEYDQAVERDRKNPDLLLKRAQALMQSDDRRFDRAYADCLTAGQLFRDRQRFDEAVQAYSRAVVLFKYGVESSRQLQAKVHAELAEVQANRADVTFDITRKRNIYEDACKHFLDATNLDGTVWKYWSGLARCHERLEEWKEASQAWEKALKLNPGDPTLTVSRAGSLVKLKDWDEAAKAYLAIIQREPKVLSYRLRLAAIYLQPIAPEKEVRPERLEAARLCLAEAVKDEFLAKQSILWSHLAVIEVAAGKIDDYQATRARMFELFKSPIGNDANNVAWVAALFKDTPASAERAIKLAAKAVSVSQQNFGYLNTYGAVLYRAGKREEAIKRLEEATNRRALVSNLSPDEQAYGNALDMLFIAMAQYTPEQPEQARQTSKLAVQTINRVKPAQQYENPEEGLGRVWARLEFEVLRREAESLINR
ncbi:tetratricopeptide repeat protein [Mycobacterium sp.]|uniref:tetratricopeptide repeat protein n=1 Tax=Mycobacterium sp. TaxID=1785 RepID=UPI003F9C416E